jgi:hypothetical protein
VCAIFSILKVQIKSDLGINETQFGLFVGIPIPERLADPHLPRHLGDQYGGRFVPRIGLTGCS